MSRAPAIGASITGAVGFAVAAGRLDATPIELARVVTLGAALGAIAYVDLTERRIPNRIVVPATVACAGLLVVQGVPEGLLSALVVVALMLVLSLVRPASFGMGDVKLALLVVAGLGGVAAHALVLGLVLAAMFGTMLFVRHGRSAAARSLPLAPFIAAGATTVLLA